MGTWCDTRVLVGRIDVCGLTLCSSVEGDTELAGLSAVVTALRASEPTAPVLTLFVDMLGMFC